MADDDAKSLKFRAPVAAEAQGVAPSFHDREAQRICWPSDLRS